MVAAALDPALLKAEHDARRPRLFMAAKPGRLAGNCRKSLYTSRRWKKLRDFWG
jgi:hypothetical protein